MKPSIAILCLHLAFWTAYAQKEDRNWVFGINCGIDFNDLSNPTTFEPGCNNLEANCSISDSVGNLLFYLAASGGYYDPMEIRDKNNQVIINGDSICAHYSSTNGAIILPMEDSYYLIYVSQLEYNHPVCSKPWPERCFYLFYSIVEKNQNGFLQVRRKNKVLFQDNLSEKIEAIKHANGKDWWMITLKSDCSNEFVKYRVTNYGVIGPFIQAVGPKTCGFFGEICASPEGSKLAMSTSFPTSSYGISAVMLYDFNRCNGEITNPVVVDSFHSFSGRSPGRYMHYRDYWGVEFSSDANFLYYSASEQYANCFNCAVYSSYQLYQYYVYYNSINLISSFNLLNDYIVWYPQLELAPDGKIYAAYWSDSFVPYGQYLGVINNPNGSPASTNFQPLGFYLGDSSRTNSGLPNMPNYHLGSLSIYEAGAGDDKTICIEDTMIKGVLLGLPPVAGVEYTWYPADSLSNPFSAQPFATPSQTTTYYVTLYDSTLTSSCNPRTDTVVVEVKNCSVGISETLNSDIKIYPNPANDYLVIEGINQPATFQLYDLAGKSIFQVKLHSGMNRVETRSLANGIYIYKVVEQSAVGKVFIEK